jgi:hypothetical protein
LGFEQTFSGERKVMKIGAAIVEIMKRKGIDIVTGYPVWHASSFEIGAFYEFVDFEWLLADRAQDTGTILATR